MNAMRLCTLWLLVVSFTMCAFGILMVLFGGTSLFGGLGDEVDRVFWPNGIVPEGVGNFQGWIYGVWGATIAGFGLLAGLVAGTGFAGGEKWARNALAVSLVLWYLADTIVSAVFHVWVNVVFNTVVLAAFAVPLAMTWRHFGEGSGPVK